MARTSTNPVSLPDALRELPDEALAELLRMRPDLVTPLPADLGQLASRASTRTSLQRALDRLDRRALGVLEAIVVVGTPTSYAMIRELSGLPDDVLRPVIDELRGLALIFGADDALSTSQVVPDLLGPYPAGLGPVDEIPLEGPPIDALLAEAGPEARALAGRLAEGPPIARGPSNAVVDAMLERGLLVRVDPDTVALPRSIGLHLRAGSLLPLETATPPNFGAQTREVELADKTAAGSVLEVLRRVEQLLEAWGRSAPTALKAGGLGVRDLRRVATGLDVDEPTAALYVETLRAAGLLALGEDGTWVPTDAYDTWRDLPPAERWTRLVRAWTCASQIPGLVGARDEKDRPRAALSPDVVRSAAHEFRHLVLEAMAAAPPGVVLTPETVLAYVRWLRPRRVNARFGQSDLADFVSWTFGEAATLGITGLDVLSTPGRLLVATGCGSDLDAVAAALSLPSPVDYVLLQADLTAVAPGPLEPALARDLSLMADAESHGGATVYRFSPASVRRALDAGRSAAELHRLLAEHSKTPVPQPLTYLVDDSARRHGRLRGGAAASYLRCDDEALLSAIVADRRTADLGIRRLAPSVLVSRVPLRALIEELRALGYEPVPEAPDGSLAQLASRTARAPEPRRAAAVRSAPEPALIQAAVRALRAGDRAASARPASGSYIVGRTASADVIRGLREAITAGWTIWIGYADQHGSTTDRVIDPVRVEGGQLTAYDHANGEPRTFFLHRITGIARI